MHDVSTKFEISTLKNVCFIDVQKYAPNMLPHTTGTLAPDVFGNSDALRGIAHRTMRPQTIHKQFLMSGQRFQLNSGRFQGKSVSELLKTLCASVSVSSKSTFSTTLKHFFPGGIALNETEIAAQTPGIICGLFVYTLSYGRFHRVRQSYRKR